MFNNKKKKSNQGVSLFKSIYAAYFILLFHVVLLGCIAAMIFLLNGIITYIVPILIVCGLAVLSFGYFLVRMIKQKGRMIQEVANSPYFKNRSVEVSFLGGMASVKIGSPVQNPAGIQVEGPSDKSSRLLDNHETDGIHEVKSVNNIIGSKHVKPDEYDTIKHAEGS